MNENTLKKKKQLIRKELRKKGILPEYGQPLNDEQTVIWKQIRQGNFNVKEILKNQNIKKECKKCGETDTLKFYHNNKSKCKKCSLLELKLKYENNELGNVYKKAENWRNLNFIRVRVLQAKHRAKRKKLEFELTDNIIEEKLKNQDGKCYITRIPLVLTANNWATMSIDRLDSNLGYTIENTILVTWFINQSKNKMLLNEFIEHMKLCYKGITENPIFYEKN